MHRRVAGETRKCPGNLHNSARSLLHPIEIRSKWQFVVLDRPAANDSANIDDAAIAELERSQARRQGFLLDPALRKAVEVCAMEAARVCFEEMGYEVEDHSQGHPYDFLCRRKTETVYLEVKGTQSDGSDVILTAGEVDFARRHRDQMALFVLHSIEVGSSEASVVPMDGVPRLILPWNVDAGQLAPISYFYGLPAE